MSTLSQLTVKTPVNTTAATTTTIDYALALASLRYDVDNHWMVIVGSLTFFMLAGFSLLEAGSVSAKNATNILYKNLMVRYDQEVSLFSCPNN